MPAHCRIRIIIKMPSVAETTVSAPRSQHSCFAALAKNSHLWTVFTALRAAASRRSIPTVTSFPRNDKLYGRSWHFIRISNSIPKCTPKPPCHCERRRSRSVAISRKGRLTCVHGQKTFPWGISPLRSDCRPHSGRNDIIKPNGHDVISSVSREIPRSRNVGNRTRLSPNTRPRGFPTEKSPAEETETI